MMNNSLFVGIIQTSLDYKAAWSNNQSGKWQQSVRMSSIEELRAEREIRHYLASFTNMNRHPDIVLLPELAVPIGYAYRLQRSAEKLEAIVIAGLDYRIESSADTPTVSNEALIIVPRRLKGKMIARRTEVRRVGKTYPSPQEKTKLQSISSGVKFMPHPTIWIFESPDLGNFAVAVCYDFMDLDRIVLYRKKIQTLFILAYNRDTTSFDHISEAIARMVFCNVIVCNCGYYGGSHAVSPFREPFKRTVYRHSGQNLPTSQLIELPLSSLKEYQSNGDGTKYEFKSLPPGFSNCPSPNELKKQHIPKSR